MLNTPGQDDHDSDLEISFDGLDGPEPFDDDDNGGAANAVADADVDADAGGPQVPADVHEDDCIPLDDSREQVGYELFDWSADELDALDDALHLEGLPHEWVSEGFEVVVHEEDEEMVDALLAETRDPDELPALVDDGDDTDIKVLETLFIAADRLRRDPTGDAVTGFLDAAEMIGDSPPYGVDEAAWERVTGAVDELIDAYHSAAPEQVITGLVERLYRFIRPMV